LFGAFERRLSPVMRQQHVAGDKVFVDYSGKKIAIVNPATGEVREVEIFVALLGASNCTYAEASWTQTLPNWIEAHVRIFHFFGGVPIANSWSWLDLWAISGCGRMASIFQVDLDVAKGTEVYDTGLQLATRKKT
jgi:hypothetical protein